MRILSLEREGYIQAETTIYVNCQMFYYALIRMIKRNMTISNFTCPAQKYVLECKRIFNDFEPLVSWTSGFEYSLVQNVRGSNTKLKQSKGPGPALGLTVLDVLKCKFLLQK